jgi:UDP-N-acetylglucosamine:LPS N-acetylglucosamine transferase
VPLPIGNGEQFVNAEYLVAEKRAEVVSQKHFTTDFLKSNIANLLSKSARAPMQGNGTDLESAAKIVALAEFAMKK